jgi:hypothetical protein
MMGFPWAHIVSLGFAGSGYGPGPGHSIVITGLAILVIYEVLRSMQLRASARAVYLIAEGAGLFGLAVIGIFISLGHANTAIIAANNGNTVDSATAHASINVAPFLIGAAGILIAIAGGVLAQRKNSN